MSSMPKCQALYIVRSCLWYFYLNKVIFAVLDVSSLPLQKMLNFYGSCFTLIFAVLLVGANFYMRPEYLTIAISDIKFQLPTSDSTEITAGGIKVTLEGPVPLDAP